MQQQLHAPDAVIGVEAAHHRFRVQGIDQGEHDHAMVVDHVGAHDGIFLIQRQARGRIIHGLVEAVVTQHTQVAKAPDVFEHGLWTKRQSQQ